MTVPAMAAEGTFSPPPPPVVQHPPAWAPYYLVPGPSPAQLDALEQHGRRNKKIGAILMGTGSALAAVGTGLWIGSAWDDNRCGDRHRRFDDCTSALAVAGVTTLLLGSAAIIPGIILYVAGGSDVDRARRLKSQYWGPVSVMPTWGPTGGGVQLQMQR